MRTKNHVQHDQMQSDLVFELVNLKVWELTCFLKGGQVQHDFKNWATTFAFRIRIPDLCSHSGSHRSNDRSSIPVVLVEESAESTWAFQGRVFRSGVAVCFEERNHEGVEGLKLVVAGEEGLDGVEYGSGFTVHRTVSVLAGT